ncbi:hypothetical protein Lalb_Chr23g0273231 [Lupinus albus]|uniref:Uncharacterized protein n=1 Tax=Lupinus albus TaxID=3870 RepID=A0A6A4ND79_LUPAL|nr:hypothetical protein Lalb_Chr23g0273231 [Lupinus albus]
MSGIVCIPFSRVFYALLSSSRPSYCHDQAAGSSIFHVQDIGDSLWMNYSMFLAVVLAVVVITEPDGPTGSIAIRT